MAHSEVLASWPHPRASESCHCGANLLSTRPAGLASKGDEYAGSEASVPSKGRPAGLVGGCEFRAGLPLAAEGVGLVGSGASCL
jgi:hypothetical protein